MNMCIRSRTEQ